MLQDPVKCSVVVPVWNPGPNIERCVDSLLGQSMPAGDYEIIFVDDGSTDGTGDRLDELAASHPTLVRVLHTPASGWPGRPRNVGVDAARGTYVQFVDNDDTLPSYALQAMYDAGVASDADIVLGRPASNFRGINHGLYRQGRSGASLADFPDVVETTTPHKMLRRSFLLRHGIRFPEAMPHEDQVFMMEAYVHAASITMLVDRCYYFYLRRLGSGRNAGDGQVDPATHAGAVERILDILDTGVDDGALRDRLARRFYRVELLNQLWSASARGAEPASKLALFTQIRRVVTTRFGPSVRAGAGAAHRTLGRLVEDGDQVATFAFADRCAEIGLRASVTSARWRGGRLVLDVRAEVRRRGRPLRCEAVEGGWALPAEFAPSVPVADRMLDAGRDAPEAELLLVSRIDAETFGLGDGLRVAVDAAGVPRVTGTVTIDPATALAGSTLSDGLWDLRLRFWFAGISRTPAVVVDPPVAAWLIPLVAPDGRSVRPFVERRHLHLDVGEWAHSLPSSLAPSSELTPLDASRLELCVDAELAGERDVQVILTPGAGAAQPPIVCRGRLTPGGPGEARTVVRPTRPRTGGPWRVWLQLSDGGASTPAALPWRVEFADHRWSARREPVDAG